MKKQDQEAYALKVRKGFRLLEEKQFSFRKAAKEVGICHKALKRQWEASDHCKIDIGRFKLKGFGRPPKMDNLALDALRTFVLSLDMAGLPVSKRSVQRVMWRLILHQHQLNEEQNAVRETPIPIPSRSLVSRTMKHLGLLLN